MTMRQWGTCVAGALALGMLPAAALAQDALFAPAMPGRSHASDSALAALQNNPSNLTVDLVEARADAVRANTDALRLNLGRGLDFTAHRLESYQTDSGALVWSGLLADSPRLTGGGPRNGEINDDPLASVMLVRNGDRITGNLRIGEQLFQIRPLKNGGHAIVAKNDRAMPADHPAEFDSLPVTPMLETAGIGTSPSLLAAATIRVMVHYTPAAAAQSGDISGLIDLAVAETNQGYANSGVGISLVLAAKAQTSYSESGSFSTDLARYRTPGDGFMDEIHTTRNSTAADVAVLVINNSSSCGLASGIGSTATTAFANVHWDCATGYYSFGHEIGHLQSARHDPKADPTKTPYAWGHGFQYAPRKGSSWRTVMAYNCTRGCPRLNYWSNPGNLYNGVAMGTATLNDNHRVLNDTAATVAGFR